ncbi:MAG: SDR family oxidoreductase [Pseudomonadota bacterium]
MSDLKGKTVMISGASRGIGEAAAEAFAAEGSHVVLLARSQGAISQIAERIGGQALAVPCDVSRYSDVSDAVAATEARFGGVDVLINNAGVIEPIARMEASVPESWSQVIDINLKGVYFGMRAVMPGMIARGGGTVITISSGAAHNALEAWSHYCTSKAGAAMLTMCLHKEAADQGIRAMGLSPGTVATKMQREIKASGLNPVSKLDWSDHIPADWPARALVWMCGPAADGHLGEELSLRDESLRRQIGLVE